ncbi:MAG: NUDIX hydrolase [Gammaproteobacteria bacterium]
MQHELLSIVDENDQVIGVSPRNIIHSSGLRHRAVHILVFNDQGQLFLQKRSLCKDLNAGLWDTSAAGHVDAGEDYDSSAYRELSEELGIAPNDLIEFLFTLPASEATGMEFIRVYRYIHNGPFKLASDEIDEGEWVSIKTVSSRVRADDPMLTETFKILWRKFDPITE